MEPVETKRIVRNLPVKLTNDELIEFGRRLAQTNGDIHTEEDRQTQIKAELKAKLGAIESERSRLAGIVSAARENRDVPCDMVFNYSQLMVEVIRLDTKEVIETRRMTEAEQQRKLFEDKPEQAGAVEKTPEEVEEIRKALAAARGDERVAEISAALAKDQMLYLSADELKAMSQEDFDTCASVAGGGDASGARFASILDRAHIAAERDGDEQHCTDCGARLDFKTAGLLEGYPEVAFVGQSCDRKVSNGPIN